MKSLYSFWGKVKSGAKRGKKLGFPTANISLHKKIPEGVYISLVKVGPWSKARPRSDLDLLSATFIGGAKTFGEKDYKAEVYILDFDKNIYSKWVSVKLFKKIHGNIQFPGEKELIKQMEKDVEEIKEYFKKI